VQSAVVHAEVYEVLFLVILLDAFEGGDHLLVENSAGLALMAELEAVHFVINGRHSYAYFFIVTLVLLAFVFASPYNHFAGCNTLIKA